MTKKEEKRKRIIFLALGGAAVVGALALMSRGVAASKPTVLGCTDKNATNYNPQATKDNGTCRYPPKICTPGAISGRQTCQQANIETYRECNSQGTGYKNVAKPCYQAAELLVLTNNLEQCPNSNKTNVELVVFNIGAQNYTGKLTIKFVDGMRGRLVVDTAVVNLNLNFNKSAVFKFVVNGICNGYDLQAQPNVSGGSSSITITNPIINQGVRMSKKDKERRNKLILLAVGGAAAVGAIALLSRGAAASPGGSGGIKPGGQGSQTYDMTFQCISAFGSTIKLTDINQTINVPGGRGCSGQTVKLKPGYYNIEVSQLGVPTSKGIIVVEPHNNNQLFITASSVNDVFYTTNPQFKSNKVIELYDTNKKLVQTIPLNTYIPVGNSLVSHKNVFKGTFSIPQDNIIHVPFDTTNNAFIIGVNG